MLIFAYWGNGGADLTMEEFPGEPWEHYLVKNRPRGYKCLKCFLVGADTEVIRSQGCKIPKPVPVVPSPPAPPSDSIIALGASAAVVGVEMAVKGCAQHAALEVETKYIEQLEIQLAEEVELEQLLEEELRLEEEALQLEIEELMEKYQNLGEEEQNLGEEEQLQMAISRSLEDSSLGDSPEPVATEPVAKGVPPKPEVAEHPVGVKGPCVMESLEPKKNPPRKMKRKLEIKDDEIPELSPEIQKKYRSFWGRYVATPQHNGERSEVKSLPIVAPPEGT